MLSRREMLCRSSTGFGMAALSGLMATPSFGAVASVDPRAPIKNVIFCYMSGGVSHIDSFDPKPRLAKEAGKPMPIIEPILASAIL